MNDKLLTNPLNDVLLSKTQRQARSADRRQLREAARNFETMFATMLLSNMRKSMAPEGLYGKGMGGDVFQSMMEEKLGEVIARRGQLGIARMIERQLSRGLTESDTGAGTQTPEDSLRQEISRAAEKYGLSPKLISAVIEQESAGDPQAVSQAGAKGVMQLMDATATMLGVKNVFDPAENIDAGSRYLKQQLDRFGELPLALAAYNAGPGAVEKYGGIPPYAETRNYVRAILARLNIIGNQDHQP